MTRARKSGISISAEEAAIVKGMLKRGDRQHDIAAWFGVNGGRIAEIAVGDNFSNVSPLTVGLPPPGPYISGRAAYGAVKALKTIRGALERAKSEVDAALKAVDEE